MRHVLAMMVAMLVPVFVNASEIETQPPEWTTCAQDAECVVVDGMCSPASVRAEYASDATSYFRKRAATLKCQQEFWKPTKKDAAARCHLERCQIIGKEKKK